MRERRDLLFLLFATFTGWMGQRLTAIALPLVALHETGSVWTTGLVAGASGLPLVTSGWWAARLRHRVTGGPALAAVLGCQTVGLLVVPVAGTVTAVHLALGGLLAGAAAAVAGPARQALTADVADRLGAGAAARALAWQDLAHRASMIVAPPIAAAAIAAGGSLLLLWCEAAGMAVAALAMITVRGEAPASSGREPTVPLRAVVRRHADLRRLLVLSGTGGAVWFAFTLGLAVLGEQTGRPGLLIAAGLTGYGIGSVAGALAAPGLSTRLPALPAAAVSWIVLGLAFVAMAAAAGSAFLVGVCAAAGGLVMPVGIAAANALISERTSGAERRTAFAADTIVHEGAATLGMLAGGAVIGLAGAVPTLVAAGLLQVAAGGWALTAALAARQADLPREGHPGHSRSRAQDPTRRRHAYDQAGRSGSPRRQLGGGLFRRRQPRIEQLEQDCQHACDQQHQAGVAQRGRVSDLRHVHRTGAGTTR